ncbi:MAG: SpoIIE family protein phosphatase [bacterium]|nr:SpoIIE family protein phosphatase [bacterium]
MDGRIHFLKQTELFVNVSKSHLAQIGDEMAQVVAKAGTIIFQEGEPGDAVYLVEEGVLDIIRDGVQVVSAEAGGCVGEFALIDDGPRSASVLARTDVRLLRWDRTAFQRALDASPGVASGILKMLTAKLRQDTATYVQVSQEREHLRQDMKRAQEIQMGMLPARDLKCETIETSGYCQPAAAVGGDYYDYLHTEQGKLGVILGDVTGHGFYSGLFVAMAKSCLHTQGKVDCAPARVMEAMNHTLSLSIQSGLLMTCCYLLFDDSRNYLTYCNAGHNFPYLYRRATDSLETLESTDLLLGVPGFETNHFHQKEREWLPGDILLLYSDGITEAANAQGEMFEEERLEATLLAHKDCSAVEIKQAVLEALAQHTHGVEQSDDITLVVARAL